MAKLFAFEDTTVTATSQSNVSTDTDIDTQLGMISMCQESITMAQTQLDIISSVQSKLTDTCGSMQVGMEYYAPIIENIAKNFGVRSNLPSLEAYSDQYSSVSAKVIALEGIASFFKAVWDRLVEFVKTLFNAFKGLIMGFKNSESKKLMTLEKIVEQTEKLIASAATLTNTNKIPSSLPGLLTAPGISEFSTSDLILQTNVRVPSFIAVIDVINKTDSAVNEELRTSMSNIANKLSGNCKTASDLLGTIKVSTKDGKLPAEQLGKVTDIIARAMVTDTKLDAVDINYFPDSTLHVISEQEVPPVIMAEVKAITGYTNCIVKTPIGAESIRNMQIYVIEVFTESQVLKSFKRVWIHDTANTTAPTNVDPIGNTEELSKLVKTIVGLSKNTLTIDVKKITDVFTRQLDSIHVSSLKINAIYTELSLLMSKLKKDVDAADGLGIFNKTNEVSIDDQVEAFKKLAEVIRMSDAHNGGVRSTILTAGKELTNINSAVVRIKNETVDAYTKYFMSNLQQYS
jgi:predicted regulator of amino acid metabolism with ACT domain